MNIWQVWSHDVFGRLYFYGGRMILIVPILQSLRQILFSCIYKVMSISFEIDDKMILLASNRNNYLEGNLLYIFRELQKYDYDIKILLNDKTNFLFKVKLMYYMSRCKYTIIDDFLQVVYPLKLRKGARLIQAWHALGAFKRFGFSRVGSRLGPSLNSKTHRNYTDAIVSADSIVKDYEQSFRMKNGKIYATGIPRSDFFFDSDAIQNSACDFFSKYPNLKGKKIILFAPTFRGKGKRAAYYPQDFLDISLLYDALFEDTVFLIKLHPFIKEKFLIADKYKDKIFDISEYNDINSLLVVTDMLITDYSSIIFEYAFLKKPICFFVSDLRKYINDRNFYYDFDEYVYGSTCYDMNGLIQFLNNPEFDELKRKSFCEKFLNKCDGSSSSRFVNQVIRQEI